MKKLKIIECWDGTINIFEKEKGVVDFVVHLTEKDIKTIAQIGN